MKTNGFLLKYLYGKSEIGTSGNQPSDSPTDSLVSVTYKELKDKRDAGKLTPGALYRITDYNCTTTQENTRSAGHQFDIVLLALSESKLAEEGWAMEHPTDVYDVTFSDGVTKKCYLNFDAPLYEGNPATNIIDVDTLLGYAQAESYQLVVNETTKTAVSEDIMSTDLEEENLSYNYFQNSNLSAWKVWYCLDNDTARFQWADDSVDEAPASIIIYDENRDENFNCVRDTTLDENIYIGWRETNHNKEFFTKQEEPSTESEVYMRFNGNIELMGACFITSYTPAQEGTGLPNGRGVIYRLIDEWNIDYPCDFKNMQMLIPIDAKGNIDIFEESSNYIYCYAFSDNTSRTVEDLSLKGHAINIKVEPRLEAEIHSAMYFTPSALFYTNVNNEGICVFSNVNIDSSQTIILVNRDSGIDVGSGCNLVWLKECTCLSIGHSCQNIILDTIDYSTFGSHCENIMLRNDVNFNYGNSGVELATKDDLQ